MSRFDFDLFVIGAGSGGVRAARMSAGMGARVGIAESTYLGGTCVNVGCVPKKLFVHAAHFREDFAAAAGYGWSVAETRFDWPTLLANKDREIARLNEVYRGLLLNSGVRLVEGRARLTGPHSVEVDGQCFTAERILVATGGKALRPPVPGAEHIITSDEAFHLERLPARALVLGGGYIAVEFAGIFHGLGVETTLIHRGELPLRGFDGDVRRFLTAQLRHKGLGVELSTQVQSVERRDGALAVSLSDGRVLETDLVMAAVGRVPNTGGLGLAEAGVQLTAGGAIQVDAGLRTSVPSIYALGDVIDRVQLTPVALAEAMAFARNQFAGSPLVLDYDNIPTAVFSQPSVGTVGLSEEQARERTGQVDIYRSEFTPLRHTLTGLGERTLMKLVVDRASDRVLGAHMVGAEAGEIVQGLAIALKAGVTKATFDATIGIHPTSAEEFVTMRSPVA